LGAIAQCPCLQQWLLSTEQLGSLPLKYQTLFGHGVTVIIGYFTFIKNGESMREKRVKSVMRNTPVDSPSFSLGAAMQGWIKHY